MDFSPLPARATITEPGSEPRAPLSPDARKDPKQSGPGAQAQQDDYSQSKKLLLHSSGLD